MIGRTRTHRRRTLLPLGIVPGKEACGGCDTLCRSGAEELKVAPNVINPDRRVSRATSNSLWLCGHLPTVASWVRSSEAGFSEDAGKAYPIQRLSISILPTLSH